MPELAPFEPPPELDTAHPHSTDQIGNFQEEFDVMQQPSQPVADAQSLGCGCRDELKFGLPRSANRLCATQSQRLTWSMDSKGHHWIIQIIFFASGFPPSHVHNGKVLIRS